MSLEGSETARKRLKQSVDSLAGWTTVAEVYAKLTIGKPRFHRLRSEALQAALDRLKPRAAGQPPSAGPPTDGYIAKLEGAVQS